jgi:hypothetical protein
MGKIIAGNMILPGTAFYLCLGFVPDWFRLRNMDGTVALELFWSKNFRAWDSYGGWELATATWAENTTAGIYPYYGGKMLGTADVGTTTYASVAGVYYKRDPITDYRRFPVASKGIVGDAATVDITDWTYYSGLTGSFNGAVTGTYIGQGSRIQIDGRWYNLTACTSLQTVAGNVSLNVSGVPSGKINCITGMYDYIPMKENEVTLAGVYIADTTVNADSQMGMFEAGSYDT